MVCLHQGTWDAAGKCHTSSLEAIHKTQSDPTWETRAELRKRTGLDFHRLQTYRLAVRQELRKRGLAVRRFGGV